MSDEYISEDKFWDDWGVIQKSDGGMFDFDDVKDQPLERVWTIVDTGAYEDENWYAMPGFHTVNKLGYIMTQREWTSGTPDAIYFCMRTRTMASAKSSFISTVTPQTTRWAVCCFFTAQAETLKKI